MKLCVYEGSSDGKPERRKYFYSSCLGFLLLKFLMLEIQLIKSQKKIFWKVFVQHKVTRKAQANIFLKKSFLRMNFTSAKK